MTQFSIGDSITLWVPGEAEPWPRPRARVVGIFPKYTARVYNPAGKHLKYRERLSWAAKRRMREMDLEPMDGPIELVAEFYFPRPTSKQWKRKAQERIWRHTKPDLDNLLKTCKDAFNGVVWIDDARVCHVRAMKVIVSGHDPVGSGFRISQMQPYEQIPDQEWTHFNPRIEDIQT